MRTRAKIAEEIAALTAEVQGLMRQWGVGLPDDRTLADFVLGAFDYERVHEVAQAVDSEGIGALAEAVGELQLAPAAEELRASVMAAFRAQHEGDLEAFERAADEVREALLPLLEARAGKWRHLWAARDLYPPSWQSRRDPAEHVRESVPGLSRWEALVQAGRALACAAEDVWLWRFWQAGRREQGEQSRQSGGSGMTEESWQREVAKHALPEEEARVVDGWAVPADDEWPESYRRSSLPQLREWQSERAARAEAPEAAAEEAGVQ